MGGIGALLDISRRALQVQSTSIRVLGNNIANVNTPGYNRRKAEIQSVATSGAAENGFGQGSKIARTIRIVDNFYDREYLARINDRSKLESQDEFLGRAESLFPLDGTSSTIGSELSEFFSSLEDLTANPSNIALRQQVIDHGNSLVDSIKDTYTSLASLQREADTRLGYEVTEVNRIAGEIANVNVQIAATETANQQDLTLRDQRDELLRQLAGKISFNTVEDSSGAVLVTLDNGFGLVTASTSRQLDFTPVPSYAPVGGYPPALDGGTLGQIVFDNDPTAGTQHTDIGSILKNGGGTIAGLLATRGTQASTDTSSFDAEGTIPEIAARVESISRWLLTNFNQTYRGADEDSGTAGSQPSSFDLNGNSPAIYGMFDSAGGLTDANGNLSPDDLAANGLSNYSSTLSFKVTDPRNIAAAYDLLPAAQGSTGFAPGDSKNLNNLIALRDTHFNFSVGNFTSSQQTVEDIYSTTVSYTGGLKSSTANALAVANDREAQIDELRTGVSGVSLDEEFANLINFQRAFEAAARMVKTSDELLGEILGLLQ